MANRTRFEKTSGAAMSAQSNTDELRPVRLERERVMARLLGGEITARKAALLNQEADQ